MEQSGQDVVNVLIKEFPEPPIPTEETVWHSPMPESHNFNTTMQKTNNSVTRKFSLLKGFRQQNQTQFKFPKLTKRSKLTPIPQTKFLKVMPSHRNLQQMTVKMQNISATSLTEKEKIKKNLVEDKPREVLKDVFKTEKIQLPTDYSQGDVTKAHIAGEKRESCNVSEYTMMT